MNITIPIEPRTKKNSQRIVKARGHYMVLPSKEYVEFEKACAEYIPQGEWIDYPCNVKCTYFRTTKRRVDLVNLQEATLDILVKYGVLKDDCAKIVQSMDGSAVGVDKDNPRTEIEITPVENGLFPVE